MEYDLNNPHSTLEAMLLELERLKDNFLILNRGQDEYLQVLTLGNNYTVEIRMITVHNLIRQYRIGLKPSSDIWNYVYSQVALKQSELLRKEDVKRILTDYVKGEELFESFYKRNISKEIGLM